MIVFVWLGAVQFTTFLEVYYFGTADYALFVDRKLVGEQTLT
jgi:hypothetical protein